MRIWIAPPDNFAHTNLLGSTFSRVMILLPFILLTTFAIVWLISITPWITRIIGSISILIFILFAISYGFYNTLIVKERIISLLASLSLFFASYLFSDMTWGFSIPLLLYGVMMVLILPFIGYFLGFLIILLALRFRPWLKARKVAASVCKFHYIHPKLDGLPWLVRWCGRFLAVEMPKKHDDFADYFVCPTCGKNQKERAFYTNIDHIIGVIGTTSHHRKIYQKYGQTCLAVKLFFPNLKKTRSADIDRLEIYADKTIDYERAVNAVLIALSNDHNRTHLLKQVAVTLYGNPPLSENTRRILANQFGQIKEIH